MLVPALARNEVKVFVPVMHSDRTWPTAMTAQKSAVAK